MLWDFFGKECVGVPQQPLGFATMLNTWDLTQVLVERFQGKAMLFSPLFGTCTIYFKICICQELASLNNYK